MPVEIKIPEVGESITEVQISEWLKAEGDAVKQDEPLAVIDSEKTTFELPSPRSGRITKILHRAGDTVKVGDAIAQMDLDEAPKEKPPEAVEKREPQKEQKAAPVSKATKPVEKNAGGKESAGEKAAEARKEETKKPADQESARDEMPTEPKTAVKPSEKKAEAKTSTTISTPSSKGEEEVVPMTQLRRTIARRLVEAQQTMAMLTTFNEVDVSAVQTLRKQYGEAFEKRYQVKLGLMSFFVKAAIDALNQIPQLNAEIRGNDIVYRNYFDVGVAIATERGLVVPVLRQAERLSFAELEKAIGDFAQRARDGKLKPDELEGGTFTITNGGAFGSLLSTPIINPPQTGILGMHAIQERPVATDGQVVIRPMMYLALTYDHRLVDGREAVLFLRRIKETIEAPARMLVEI